MRGMYSFGLLLIVALCGASGCDGDSGRRDVGTTDLPREVDVERHDGLEADVAADRSVAQDVAPVTLSGQVQPIFTASCASGACHGGPAPKAGLNLGSMSAYSQLVNTAAFGCPTLKRVEPGDPAASYLVQKIEGSGSCFNGLKMPVGGSLVAREQEIIRTWVKAGAAND